MVLTLEELLQQKNAKNPVEVIKKAPDPDRVIPIEPIDPNATPTLERDFKVGEGGWEGLHLDFPSWVRFDCPACGKFHSNNFLFTLQKDKTEYLGKCLLCNAIMRIKIPLDINNKLYDELVKNHEQFNAELQQEQEARKAGYKYLIFIRPATWENCKYDLHLQKEFGSHGGQYGQVETKEQALQTIRDQIKSWNERIDSDCKHYPVTDKTLFFWSFTPDITKAEVLNEGQTTFSTPTQNPEDPLKDKEVKVSFRYMFKVGSSDLTLQVNDVLYTGTGELIGKITAITQEDGLDGEIYTMETPNGVEKIHYSYLASVKATKEKATKQATLF